MYLSVIIPTHNEEKSLATTITDFLCYLKKQSYTWEILIVNDGSNDNTALISSNLKKNIPNIRIITFTKNLGKGAAVRKGLLSAHGDYRMFIDADNATSIDHVEKAWQLFKNGADVIIGSRNVRDAKDAILAIPQPLLKVICGKAGNFIFQLLTIRGIRDTQCGFKLFTKEFVEDIIPKTKMKRWALDAEILTLAKKYHYHIKIIGVNWKDSKQKSKVGIKGYFSALYEAFKIRWGLIRKKY